MAVKGPTCYGLTYWSSLSLAHWILAVEADMGYIVLTTSQSKLLLSWSS